MIDQSHSAPNDSPRRITEKRCLWILCIAFALSLSFFARHICGIAIAGYQYTPLVYNPADLTALSAAEYSYKPDDAIWDETWEYARFTHEILRGELLGANASSFRPYLIEGSLPEHLWYRDRLGPMTLALMAAAFGGSVPDAFILSDLVFPLGIALAILFLCTEFLGFTLSFSFVATAAVMWFNLGDAIRLHDVLFGNSPNGATFLRTPYPQLSFLLFTLFVVAMMNFHRRASVSSLMLLGVSLLLSLYAYFYLWAFVVVMAGLYALANSDERCAMLVLRSAPQRKWQMWLTFLVVAILSFPVWASLASNAEVFRDSFVRLFGVYTHSPDWRRTLMIAPFLAVAISFITPSWPSRWMWLLFWVTCASVVNQQIITGRAIQPVHWTGAIIEPFGTLFLFDLAFCFRRIVDAPRINRILSNALETITIAVVICVVLVQTYVVGWIGAKVATPYNRINEQFSELLAFLAQPELRNYGFLTNDPYLRAILPAYVIQKSLTPSFIDPLSTTNLRTLQTAASDQFGSVIGTVVPLEVQNRSVKLRFDNGKVLFVLNRIRLTYYGLDRCQDRFENANFIVAVAQKCTTN
jgi:hypothetical protein